jgi:hypothetical protein
VAEREASGDFDYRLDDPADVEALTSIDAAPEAQESAEFDYLFRDPVDDSLDEADDNFWDDADDSGDNGHFDAFKASTWSFQPPPTPWYRTKQAVTAMIAAAAAMAAIVVSAVLLVVRSPSDVVDVITSVTPTAPTSAAPTELASSEPEPPPLPPPPSETVASPVDAGPVYTNPRVAPRQTKEPEINVTRSPMSVAPQQRTPPNQRH